MKKQHGNSVDERGTNVKILRHQPRIDYRKKQFSKERSGFFYCEWSPTGDSLQSKTLCLSRVSRLFILQIKHEHFCCRMLLIYLQLRRTKTLLYRCIFLMLLISYCFHVLYFMHYSYIVHCRALLDPPLCCIVL